MVGMDNPPDSIRPGLSSTTKITTATRKNVLTIPLQALTDAKGDLIRNRKEKAVVNPESRPAAEKANKEETGRIRG